MKSIFCSQSHSGQLAASRLPRLAGRTALVLSALAAWASPTLAEDTLQFVETKDLRVVYYAPEGASLVPRAVRNLSASLEANKRIFGYAPADKVNVLLQDFSDDARAAVVSTPRNRLFINTAPQTDPYEYTSAGELLAWISAHEISSLMSLDKAGQQEEGYRGFFRGKVAVDSSHPESIFYRHLTSPRITSPAWYHEGAAVFSETWLMGGLGRAQGGYDEMVFRAMVKDGAHFYDPLGLVAKGTEVTFETGAEAYLYGTRFMNYLALTYGPTRLASWLALGADSERYYADDFTRLYGLSISKAWQDWITWEKQFQTENLASVREHPVTPYRDLTPTPLGKMSRPCLSGDGSTLYAATEKPGQLAHLIALRLHDGKISTLQEIVGPSGVKGASLACDGASATLFYTSNNENYRNLEAYDLTSGTSKTLIKRARIGDLAFNAADRSLWGIRFNHGQAMLVRVPAPYTDFAVVHVFAYGERPFGLDVSNDGSMLAYSLIRPGKTPSTPRAEVVVVRTAEAGVDPTPVYRTFTMNGAVPEGIVFSENGRFLYGSSYYTGVSNLYRYDLEEQSLVAVSNTELGLFSPLPLDENHLVASRFSSGGFTPVVLETTPTTDMSAVKFLGAEVAERHPEVKQWMQRPADSIPYEASIVRRGAYRPLRELALQSVIPTVEGYKNSVTVGMAASFSDPIGFSTLNVDVGYSPDAGLSSRERTHFAVDFHQGRWTMGAKWNGANFYDLFGPVRRSREGYSAYVNYDRPLVFDPPMTVDFEAHAAFYGGLDALPGFQNVRSPSQNLSTLSVGFKSTNLRSSPGSVDYEAGQEWMVMSHGYGTAGSFTPSLQLEYHAGFPLPINHSSLWFRSAAVLSGGNARSPLANTYLGGFGNNYVDTWMYTGAQRYRGYMLSSMPGFGINALSGRNLGKVMIEWCLPPLRLENSGRPGFYAYWMRPEIFASAVQTNPDDRLRRETATNVGIQLDFSLMVMHRLPIRLSVGAAKGFGAGGKGKNEFMLSILVL